MDVDGGADSATVRGEDALLAALRRGVAEIEADLRLEVPLLLDLQVGREWTSGSGDV